MEIGLKSPEIQNSREGLIHRKQCLGQNGQVITIYKIRTMEQGASARFSELAAFGLDEFGKLRNETRTTFIGQFLRRYWIDELPQLYNLFRGDIKLVGIRPNLESTWLTYYPREIMERALKQKPGLMGVQYAYKDSDGFQTTLSHLEEYLDRWEQDPKGTDRDYFHRIWRNIVFNGVRSR